MSTRLQTRQKAVELMNLLIPEKILTSMSDEEFDRIEKEVIAVLDRDGNDE